MKDKLAQLIPDVTYHFYNRANGNEKLFLNNGNYLFFLKQYKLYIGEIAETFCYCVMPNHFHFLIRIKSEKDLTEYFFKNKKNFGNIEKLISNQFSNFFNSYSKAFNKQQNRKGNLFMRTFKRIRINDESYFRNAVHYIHHNPVEARLSERLVDYKYSSYSEIVTNQPTYILKEEILESFGGLENFIHFHESDPGSIDLTF